MPSRKNKKSNRRSRRRNNRKTTESSVFTTVAATASSTTTRSLNLNQLIPDVSSSRAVVIKSITVTLTPATGTPALLGSIAQTTLNTQPFVEGGPYASMPWKSLSDVNSTTISVVPRHPGQLQPIVIGGGPNTFWSVTVYSVQAGTWSVNVKTRYHIQDDVGITTY